jgi:5-oxopent-3-ene-1,2,5-tricarboxylate decarboxylase/2-hydroxyhepta-2,4-diene-1,7-dioate isomerase
MSSTESVSKLDARHPSAGTPTVDLARRLQTLPVCTAMDILRDVTPSRMVLRGIQPISSVPERTLAGPVRTLRYLPVRHDAPRSPAGPVSLRTVDSLRPGEILVLAAGGFDGGAVFGDMMALGALSRGAAAVVADGAVRDVVGMDAVGLPVFGRCTYPVSGLSEVVAWDADIAVQCGGALVQPGDWILADREAAVVVPFSLVQRLDERMDQFLDEDRFCQRLIAERGATLQSVHPLSPALRAHFERFRRDGQIPTSGDLEAAA